MRCPKCQYISFDSGERCRNCGYEFSLTSETRPLDLPIQTGDEAIGPLSDFALESRPGAAQADTAKLPDTVAPTPRPISSFDLPLFKERRTSDDPPVAAPPLAPRTPLSVRRSTPTPPRSSNRMSVDDPVLDLGMADSPPRSFSRGSAVPQPVVESDSGADAAPVVPRILAGLIDSIILLTIGSIVLYLTLRMCRLPLSRVALIPPLPFISFLLLIAGGYFTLFTAAGGQTIGKMAAGIRVVSMDQEYGRVTLGHSVLRAAAYAVSALPAGVGFLLAIVGADKRAIHDRLADTRVVKA
jgi:uncharacterized RDD family membrane protein YckC